MRIVGRRREPPISFTASSQLLAQGARFNEEFQKLPMGRLTAIPKGVRRFRTHAEANRYDQDCLAQRMMRLALRRK